MKTPIEKAIKEFENKDKISISDAITILQKLLPYEKKLIENSFNNGLNCNVSGATGEEYYNIQIKSNQIK